MKREKEVTAPLIARDIRASAMVAFAHCLTQLAPAAQLLGGEVTARGFFYEFVAQLPPDAPDRIQEAYRALVKAHVSLYRVESLRDNAAKWFEHRGQKLRARRLARLESASAAMAVLGDFTEPCIEPIAPVLSDLVFVWMETAPFSESLAKRKWNGTRAEIALFATRADAQRFRRHTKRMLVQGTDHVALGKSMDLFFREEAESGAAWIWNRRGVRLLDHCRTWWSTLLNDAQIAWSHDPDCIRRQVACGANRIGRGRKIERVRRIAYWTSERGEERGAIRDGLLRTKNYLNDAIRVFCPKEELLVEFSIARDLIERVGRLLRSPTMWSLRIPSSGPWRGQERDAFAALRHAICRPNSSPLEEREDGPLRAELNVQCARGHWWPLGNIEVKLGRVASSSLKAPSAQLRFSLFGSLERMVALLLERENGQLPLWLDGEVLVLNSRDEIGLQRANALRCALEREGIGVKISHRCNEGDTTGARAKLENIAFGASIGVGEVNSGIVNLCDHRAGSSQRVCLSDLAAVLQRARSKSALEEEQ